MLDVGTVAAAEQAADGKAGSSSADSDDLAVFADRIAAAGSDRSTASAHARIRRTIAAGEAPPGLRRLAEALAASVSELPPPPRRPSEDAGSVVAAMREHALVVLEDFDATAVAGAVAALLADGRRIVVTATPTGLTAVRAALAPEVVDRVLDRLPALPAGELRELRRLLATSTPARRARADQRLPREAALPPADEVARLCLRAGRSVDVGPGPAAGMVPGLLAALEPVRRDAVVSVARCVTRALGALHPRDEHEWVWSLLSDLIYGRRRPVFDGMLEETAQAVAALDRARYAPPVTVTGPLPAEAGEVLRRYRDFLSGGGRSRPYFRSAIQRDVSPVLLRVLVDGRSPDGEADVACVIDHLDLGVRLAAVDTGCAELGIPAPRDEGELVGLTERLVKVAGAARSVGALRHDVLFIAADSPLSVPDVATADQVATAILDYAEHGSAAEAARRLDRMAADLAGHATGTAPEHELAVAALRARDAAGYADALEALGAARREGRDEARRVALLGRLAQSAPQLAAAWTASTERPVGLGLACFVPTDALLSALPPPDSADVVLVVGAAPLGVERLLLTAVAPRLMATVAPGERPEAAPSMLSVLHRAAALVIRGRSGTGRVVHLAGAQRMRPAVVGQAGA